MLGLCMLSMTKNVDSYSPRHGHPVSNPSDPGSSAVKWERLDSTRDLLVEPKHKRRRK